MLYRSREKETHPHIFIYKTMVRIIAEMSVHTPTASSGDRYKYRFGYGGGGCDNRQQIIYRRPAPALGEKMSQKKSEKQPLLVIGETEYDACDAINIDYCGSNFINSQIDKINTMVDIHRNMHEMQQMQQMQQMREINEKEKEKQKEKEPWCLFSTKKRERQRKPIHKKLFGKTKFSRQNKIGLARWPDNVLQKPTTI